MNTQGVVGILIGMAGLMLAFWRWQSVRIARQNERIKAILLGIHWLMSKSTDKPDDYVLIRLRDALREEE